MKESCEITYFTYPHSPQPLPTRVIFSSPCGSFGGLTLSSTIAQPSWLAPKRSEGISRVQIRPNTMSMPQS
ncbi:uncharacterized protein LAJ45_03451 [Morchella importuna]|uniref:uncharacterized protein n=1 Tax=Morchella importuna TaxID=1174673 RepID=UPI001E8DE225|nr:uncharacterized protein LAJ45_03451 [Morchella importuna]KAH8152610.1 hypothetical protein LAJ45_03451 [Morchella importuna]